MNRSIRRMYWAVVIGFGLIAAFLGWWQVVAAENLKDRRGNPLTAEREQRVDRGQIFTADGVVLASTRKVRIQGKPGFRRVYPNGGLAPHVVGYATPELGNSGIESTFNQYLAGNYGTASIAERFNLDEKQGANVQLTIDSRVQRAAVDALAGQTGAVVALDPRTNAVLAMTSGPTFTLADVATNFAKIRSAPGSPLLNRATQSRQPPGSTFKTVTAATALTSEQYTPESRFTDTGSFVGSGRPITNFGGARFGAHDLTFALTKSVNTTFARIGQDLGADQLGETMTALGFGEKPDVPDLPENALVASGRFSGTSPLPNAEPGIDAARVAIGQEQLLATPLQMAMVAATIGNDGRLRRPYLVSRVVDRRKDVVREGNPDVVRQAISADVAAEVSDMMRSVVSEGTGTAAALTGLEVAGKTGTAEGAAGGRNQAWFIGFAPADNPVVAVAVLVENTTSTGGGVAAPIAGKVMRAAVEVSR